MKMINVALPKGRLGEKVYNFFKNSGYECPSIEEPSRKLIFENPEKGVRYFWVKPSDVAIYVERGAADIGVAGGKGEALLFKKGEAVGKIPESEVIDRILKEVEAMS